MAPIQLNHQYAAVSIPNHRTPLHRARKTASFRVRAASPATTGQRLIQSGAVRAIPPKLAGAAVGAEGYVLLDIRPVWEWDRARVRGAVHVPLFVADEDGGPVTLLRKWVHFGYIGLWTGQHLTELNPDFVAQVESAVPDKGTKLLVACGEGLRSTVATSKLYGASYKNLGWLAGGFNQARDGDFADVEGDEKLQHAAIGGTSYFFLKLLILLGVVD